jgi:hypothetical protein
VSPGGTNVRHLSHDAGTHAYDSVTPDWLAIAFCSTLNELATLLLAESLRSLEQRNAKNSRHERMGLEDVQSAIAALQQSGLLVAPGPAAGSDAAPCSGGECAVELRSVGDPAPLRFVMIPSRANRRAMTRVSTNLGQWSQG